MPAEQDDALMARVRTGDSLAYAEILRRHEGTLRRLCRTLLRDQGAADEAAQDVFLSLWLERQRYQERGQLRAYLCRLARNRCYTLLRRRKLAQFFLLRQPEPAPVATPTHRSALLVTLDTLPEHFRLPLHLRFVEDLDYPEIALVIGRTVSATRSRIHYGLKALEQALAEQGSVP